MNGLQGEDLWLVNERIHAMHADAARQRLVRPAGTATSTTKPHRTIAAAIDWSRRVLHGRLAPVAWR